MSCKSLPVGNSGVTTSNENASFLDRIWNIVSAPFSYLRNENNGYSKQDDESSSSSPLNSARSTGTDVSENIDLPQEEDDEIKPLLSGGPEPLYSAEPLLNREPAEDHRSNMARLDGMLNGFWTVQDARTVVEDVASPFGVDVASLSQSTETQYAGIANQYVSVGCDLMTSITGLKFANEMAKEQQNKVVSLPSKEITDLTKNRFQTRTVSSVNKIGSAVISTLSSAGTGSANALSLAGRVSGTVGGALGLVQFGIVSKIHSKKLDRIERIKSDLNLYGLEGLTKITLNDLIVEFPDKNENYLKVLLNKIHGVDAQSKFDPEELDLDLGKQGDILKKKEESVKAVIGEDKYTKAKEQKEQLDFYDKGILINDIKKTLNEQQRNSTVVRRFARVTMAASIVGTVALFVTCLPLVLAAKVLNAVTALAWFCVDSYFTYKSYKEGDLTKAQFKAIMFNSIIQVTAQVLEVVAIAASLALLANPWALVAIIGICTAVQICTWIKIHKSNNANLELRKKLEKKDENLSIKLLDRIKYIAGGYFRFNSPFPVANAADPIIDLGGCKLMLGRLPQHKDVESLKEKDIAYLAFNRRPEFEVNKSLYKIDKKKLGNKEDPFYPTNLGVYHQIKADRDQDTVRHMPVADHSAVSPKDCCDAADFINKQLSEKHVYVHCMAGCGRSAIGVASYLLKYFEDVKDPLNRTWNDSVYIEKREKIEKEFVKNLKSLANNINPETKKLFTEIYSIYKNIQIQEGSILDKILKSELQILANRPISTIWKPEKLQSLIGFALKHCKNSGEKLKIVDLFRNLGENEAWPAEHENA
jgi:protein-tyrosine phosphatase